MKTIRIRKQSGKTEIAVVREAETQQKPNCRKASFTIEAAFLVPIAATIIVLMVGYIYYTHETGWSRAIAYEADFYGIQRREQNQAAESLIQKRVSARNGQKPMPLQQESFQVSAGKNAVSVSWSGGILRDVFHGRFGYEGTAQVDVIRPVEAKRTVWLARHALGMQKKES